MKNSIKIEKDQQGFLEDGQEEDSLSLEGSYTKKRKPDHPTGRNLKRRNLEGTTDWGETKDSSKPDVRSWLMDSTNQMESSRIDL